MTYELLASDISRKWDWHGESLSRASVTSDIRELLALNSSFRFVVAHGTSDLVTPYAVSRYVVNHLPPLGSPERVRRVVELSVAVPDTYRRVVVVSADLRRPQLGALLGIPEAGEGLNALVTAQATESGELRISVTSAQIIVEYA